MRFSGAHTFAINRGSFTRASASSRRRDVWRLLWIQAARCIRGALVFAVSRYVFPDVTCFAEPRNVDLKGSRHCVRIGEDGNAVAGRCRRRRGRVIIECRRVHFDRYANYAGVRLNEAIAATKTRVKLPLCGKFAKTNFTLRAFSTCVCAKYVIKLRKVRSTRICGGIIFQISI